MLDRAKMHERERRYRTSKLGRATRNRRQKRNRALNPKPARDWRLKKYGLTQNDYDQMVEAQGRACAICFRAAELTQWKKLRVDHDHETGKIRGLLCHHCNVALGYLSDCIPIFDNAIRYLRRAGKSDSGL